jgi:hypothetical protein
MSTQTAMYRRTDEAAKVWEGLLEEEKLLEVG